MDSFLWRIRIIFENKIVRFHKLKKISMTIRPEVNITKYFQLFASLRKSKTLKKIALQLYQYDETKLEVLTNFLTVTLPNVKISLNLLDSIHLRSYHLYASIVNSNSFSLVKTPSKYFSNLLRELKISIPGYLFKLDEVYCLSRWIHTFDNLKNLGLFIQGSLEKIQEGSTVNLPNQSFDTLKSISLRGDDQSMLELLWKLIGCRAKNLTSIFLEDVLGIPFEILPQLAKVSTLVINRLSAIMEIYKLIYCKSLMTLKLELKYLDEKVIRNLTNVLPCMCELYTFRLDAYDLQLPGIVLIRLLNAISKLRRLFSLNLAVVFKNEIIKSRFIQHLFTSKSLRIFVYSFINFKFSEEDRLWLNEFLVISKKNLIIMNLNNTLFRNQDSTFVYEFPF
jgi:hypothetical protein